MRPAWQRLVPLAPLPLLPLLAAMAALTAAEPCLDGLGRLHHDGAVFYDFPDARRPCVIYKCVKRQKQVFRDSCKKKPDFRSEFVSPKSNLQLAPAQIIHSKSNLPAEDVASRTPTMFNGNANLPTLGIYPFLNQAPPSVLPVPAPAYVPVHGSLPESSPGSVSGSVSGPVPGAVPGAVSGSVPRSVPGSVPGPVPGPVPRSVPGPAPRLVPVSVPVPGPMSASATGDRASQYLSAIRVSQCTGQNGRRHYEGQSWWETTDRPCLQYVCRSSQKLLVKNVTCTEVRAGCSEKFVFGKCCPEPTDCVAPQGCTGADGRVYQERETWYETVARPCSRYTCLAGQRRLVQNITCDPPNPLCRSQLQIAGRCCPKQAHCGCLDPGTVPQRQRLHGEQWPSASDPCVTLHCDEGKVIEKRQLPQPQPCPTPPHSSCVAVPPLSGVCACPKYTCDSSNRPCISKSGLQLHGASWEHDTCIIGTCHDGAVQLARVTCPPLPAGCTPELGTDPCCATCQSGTQLTVPPTEPVVTTETTTTPVPPTEPAVATTLGPEGSCEFNGAVYLHNTNWQEQCGSHVCQNGEVYSEYVQCPKSTSLGCAPIYQPGNCCVRWSCKSASFLQLCDSNLTTQATPYGRFCYQPGSHEGSCRPTTQPIVPDCCPVFECLKNCQDEHGVPRHHATSWEEGCSLHSCFNGTISSEDKLCPPTQNENCRLTNPGECCPIYECACEVDGTRREDGEHWTSACSDHWCSRGEVESRHVACPQPPRPDCALVKEDGQCCAKFECSCDTISCPAAPTQPGCQQSGVSADGCCTIYSCAGDCRDELGRVHTDGSRWFVNCTQYKCSEGVITEVTEPCLPPPSDSCRHVYKPGDSCCPIYDCPPPACTVGQRSFDGCNFCECLPPGHLVCTTRTCQERECSIGSSKYQHGATWTAKEDACLVYSCGFGNVLGKILLCPPKPGPHCKVAPWSESSGKTQCCPTWDCKRQDPCPDGAASRPRTWQDDCHVCTCSDAGVVCTEFDCHGDCEHEGGHYKNLDHIPGRNTCDERICVDGAAISVYETCQTAPNYTCSFVNHDECCSTFTCEDLPGMSTPCKVGEIFQSDDQECLYCECVVSDHASVPQMLCTKRDCVNTGCYDGDVYHEHGTIWATADRCRQGACVSGQVLQLEVQCPQTPPGADCVPVHDDNRCCPLYYCGEKCQDGVISERGDSVCFCKHGVEFCSTD